MTKKLDVDKLAGQILDRLNDNPYSLNEVQDGMNDVGEFVEEALGKLGLNPDAENFETLHEELSEAITFIPAHYELTKKANTEALKKKTA